MSSDIPRSDVTGLTGQSPPIDWSFPVRIEPTFLKDKTIVITGGASGLGAGFARKWASHGAHIIVGDISVAHGEQLVAELRRETNNSHHHFIHLDVTSWPSQVAFFREAAQVSPHGGIDTVVANAGINHPEQERHFREPNIDYRNTPSPPPPKFATIDVNLTGVLYTTHLGMWYLKHNPGSKPASATAPPGDRDRHLLLLSSVAGICPIVSQCQYAVSKHAVVGLFRTLRAESVLAGGVRVNMVCPYFIDTSIVSSNGRLLLAGGGMGVVDDVVQAASLFVSRPDVIGRAVVVGPKMRVSVPVDQDDIASLVGVDGVPQIENVYEVVQPEQKWKVQEGLDGVIQERAIWEIYAHDFENTDLFNHRMVSLLNAVSAARGWYGFAMDILAVVTPGVSRRFFGKH